jgi:hypothetical protein
VFQNARSWSLGVMQSCTSQLSRMTRAEIQRN